MWTWLIVLVVAEVAALYTNEKVLPGATIRATETLNGLFHYYWQLDPRAKSIGFFFACGQIGGWGGPEQWDKCSCNTRDACTNCYRWWDAVALESLATYGIYMNTKRNASIANTIFAHSPYNSKWNATKDCTFIDDFLWYGIAYLRVYEWLKNPRWLNRSIGIYNWTWKYGWDDPCGGVWWNNCDTSHFKDSITILQFLHLASKLSYLFPNVSSYLADAEKIWNWFFSFDNGYGLMSSKYLVSTGANPERCCNSSSADPFSRCVNSKISGTSYNQGLLMSSAAYLYRRTGNKTCLSVGMRALEAILVNYTTKEGIIIDEPRTYQTYQSNQCWGASSDPGGDYFSFQGVFMLHLSYFIELLKKDDNFPEEIFLKTKIFIEKTSDAAWSRSAVFPPFNVTDACNAQLKNHLKDNFPRFHWWWGEKASKQIIPSDPRIFFHKTELRCITINDDNTQIWQGIAGSEDKCMQKCMKNNKCSKYLYNEDRSANPDADCWIWSYNRSNHICPQSDSDFNVGIKRPIGASCKNHCGSKEPLKLEHGGICYCDSNCTKHLDCCLDYADLCLPDKPPTCKGLCNVVEPRPIRGGGYCWCMSGCNPWYTDNNSDGSCCPDYNTFCQEVLIPPCLDARSQGSALNLFLAHAKLNVMKQSLTIS